MATRGGEFQFSNLDLTCQLINTAGHMQIVSGSQVTDSQPFSPPSVPEPASLVLLAAGLGGVGWFRTRHKA